MSTEELQQQDESVEGVGQEAQEQQGAAPSQDDAAFQEGFDTARNGGEPEPEPEPPKLIAGYTEDEVREAFEKAREVDKLKEQQSKIFGAMGSMKQSMTALQARQQGPSAPVNVNLKRLSQEYPEMAQSLMEDLRESLGSGGGGGVNPEVVERMVSDRMESFGKSTELKLLSVMHPDWRAIPSTPEFVQWKGTLAPDELQVVEDSWDSASVGEALGRFKAWKSRASQTKQQRQSRLEAAVTPRGTRQATPSMTDNDAFLSGFKSVRG